MRSSAPDRSNGFGRQRYSVVLAVGEGEIQAARRTAELLQRHTVSAEKLILAAPESVLSQLGRDESFKAFVPSPLAAQSRDAAFVRAVGQAPHSDVLFVRAGALVPEAWDVRLIWTSRRHSGVATISPATSPQVPDAPMSGDAIDQYCYEFSQMNAITARPSPECILVTAEAALAVAREWEASREEGSFKSFVDITGRLRFQHLLADHIYVDVSGCRKARRLLRFRDSVPGGLRRLSSGPGLAPALRIGRLIAPRQLHVMHSWGGGLSRWVSEYCRADSERQNYLLKSIGDRDGFGRQLVLYRSAEDHQPIRRWILNPMIPGTALHHEGYLFAIEQLMLEFGIENIIVSSLIGHSLDILRTARPTAMVCHDYYPFCPALNITFDSLCTSCDSTRLTECTKVNPYNRFFENVPPSHWLDLRKEFFETVERHSIPLVAPSESTAAHYSQLAPALQGRFSVIPHGTQPMKPISYAEGDEGRFKILILGSLAISKGLEIIKEIQGPLGQFADLYFVGCGNEGKQFENVPAITVIRQYQWEELSGILTAIQPDLAVLPSVVPETFSLTLQELFELNIPTLATRLGSFSDRIVDGVNGFLCDASASAVLAAIERLSIDRAPLAAVRNNLAGMRHRTVTEMLRDYNRLLASPSHSSRSYFAPDTREILRSALFTRCQVFWRSADHPFTEANSAATRYAPVPEPQVVTVPIPAMPAVPAVLRIDPAEMPGVLDLQRLTLRGKDGETLWNWEGHIEGIASRFFHIVPIQGQGYAVLCLINDDPHLQLPLTASALLGIQAGGTLEIELQWHRKETAIELLEGECAKPDHDASLGYLLSYLKKTVYESKAFETDGYTAADFQLAEQRIKDLEGSLSWRITRPLRVLADDLYPLLRLVTTRRR